MVEFERNRERFHILYVVLFSLTFLRGLDLE